MLARSICTLLLVHFHPSFSFRHNSFIHQPSKQHTVALHLANSYFPVVVLECICYSTHLLQHKYSTHFWLVYISLLVNPFLPLFSDWHLLIHHQGRRPRHCMFQPNIKVSVQQLQEEKCNRKSLLKGGPVFQSYQQKL